ncbi:hypothetical protein ACMAZD_26155 (plasmid) [Vibrio sp. nBUS_14]|uniref:hypothetical protein n=1 Tax=Vibrio sp. nBUS_14 TaxID=3395321 RepID=UPI003EB982FF
MNEFQPMVFGVFTGLMVSFLLYMSKTLLLKARQTFEAWSYRGIYISGQWQGEALKGNRQWELSLSIIQKGRVLNGDYEAITRRENDQKHTSKMSFEGEIRDGFISLTFTPSSDKSLSFGSMLLQAHEQELVGKQIFRNIRNGKAPIHAYDVKFKRSS